MSRVINTNTLPSAMEAKLRSVRIRQAILVAIQAIALAAAVLIAVMVVCMFVDWMLTLTSVVTRVLLTAATIVASVATLAMFAKPLANALGWSQAAENVDTVVPQLEERWTTVANVAGSPHAPTSAIGKAMLEQVTSEAVAIGDLVQPNRVAPPSTLKPSLMFLGACGLLCTAFLATNWAQTSVLLRRFWSPTLSITATQLSSISGDIQVPRGETVELVSQQAGLARGSAMLTTETESGIVDVFDLKPSEDRPQQFVHTMRADQPFRYRMIAGDGRCEWRHVKVIDYPVIGEVKFAVTAPAYVDRPPYVKPLIPSRLRAVQGSDFRLALKPVEELERLTLALTIDDPSSKDSEPVSQVIELQRDDDGWYRFDTQLLGNVSFKPLLLNSHGLTNEDQHTCHIQVIPDKAPVARVINRDDDMAVGIDDVVDVKLEAHDDHGIASAELVVYDDTDTAEGEEPKILKTIPIPLGDQKFKKHVLTNIKLDLSKLGIEEGATISYSVRVTDTRDLELDPEAMELMARAKRDASKQNTTTEKSASGNPEKGNSQSEPTANIADADQRESDQNISDPPMKTDNKVSADRGTAQAAKKQNPERSSKTENESIEVAEVTPADAGESNDSQDTPAAESLAAQDENSGKLANDPDKSTDARAAKNEQEARTDDLAKALLGQGSTEGKQDRPSMPKPDQNQSANAKQPSAFDAKPKPASNQQNTNTNSSNQNQPNGAPSNVVRVVDRSKEQTLDEMKSETRPKPDEDQKKNSDEIKLASNDTPIQKFKMSAQRSTRPQDTFTNRRRLKIAARLSAVAESDSESRQDGQIRDRVVAIDKMLAETEDGLSALVERKIRDADRTEQFRRLDKQLGAIEKYITDLRNETKEKQFAFVGLQMVDIARTNITPARDRVFVAIRDPKVADRNAQQALQHVVRARETLGALLKRYDRVARDRKLKKEVDEIIEMYEVYVERQQSLMRERQQNRNPLDRKMQVIEVDQEYLDRVAEVQTMRREMFRELGRLLGDDPRLLARYMDLIRRQRKSLRSQLSELAEQQDDVAMELSDWQAVREEQRDALWSLVAELRLQLVTPLAKDAAEMAERLEKQMPLVLDPKSGTAKLVIAHAAEVARLARKTSFDVGDFQDSAEQDTTKLKVLTGSDALVAEFSELLAALDQLRFENEANEEVTTYVDGRFLEVRTVADQADAWLNTARFLKSKQYHELALIEQQRVSIETELLRAEMLNMETQVGNEFARAQIESVPGPVLDLVRQLQGLIQEVTFSQAAAGFALSRNKLELAETHQAKALDGFDKAERLFDKMRRAIVDALDEYDQPNPNIADLRDPTLDEFLARLEREPNLEARLGIPNRRRNLRLIAESMTWQQNGSGLLAQSSEAAANRAKQAMKMKRNNKSKKPAQEITEEDREKRKEAEALQRELEESLVKLQKQVEDPKLTEQQRRQIRQAAKKLQESIEEMNEGDSSAARWQELVAQEGAQALMRAMAAGEKVPDEQWNRLLSKLGDGLWQVRGTMPPEEYRKSIEQYQQRLRDLMSTIEEGV